MLEHREVKPVAWKQSAAFLAPCSLVKGEHVKALRRQGVLFQCFGSPQSAQPALITSVERQGWGYQCVHGLLFPISIKEE